MRSWLLVWLGLCGVASAMGATLSDRPQRVFTFHEPDLRRYEVEILRIEDPVTSESRRFLPARRVDRPEFVVELGSRLVLTPSPGTAPQALVDGRPLRLGVQVHDGTWVVQAPDAWTAAEEAERLGTQPGVQACVPVMRFPWTPQDAYAPRPNDPYVPSQWHLENRDTNGHPVGIDINVRAAWPWTRGTNIIAAVVDDGVEMTHPDLVARFNGHPHFNFGDQTTNAGPSLSTAFHSTAVAGLLGATADNRRGISGVAPEVGMASWVIFRGSQLAPDTLEMKQMFEYASNVVQVQNHSWGAGGTQLYPLPPFEDLGISNAITAGRGGLGVVLLHAASNGRASMGDANADGYASDPRVITVAAARSDGRVTRYSNPGACVLVAGPSSEIVAGGTDIDPAFPTLFTTDLTGVAGRNQVVTLTDSADYRFDSTGFTGTSGATPVVSGIVALMLSVNPLLSYRDVQQALLVSSRHADLADPALQTNGAGLRVSYNLGYGIPDAGLAVSRAAAWRPRPRREQVTFTNTVQRAIPDDGLRVEISGPGVPASLLSIPATAAFGAHPDVATGWFPIATLGVVLAPPGTNLTGVAALCQRGTNTFVQKIGYCVGAGAPIVIVYNNTGLTDRLTMLNTDFVPVPAVLIGRTAGEALDALVRTNAAAQARLVLLKTNCTFHVTNTLVCEHVWVRLQSDHPRRGDVRLTLVSPAGTRSLLQRVSTDASPLPADGWTYYSVDHFFEGTAGTWTVEVSDEDYAALSGKVLRIDLTLTGTPITDSDRDGLDDAWELAHFGDLSARPSDDPDGDGVPNAIEQLLGTDPQAADVNFRLDLASWGSGIARLSWPGTEGSTYRILTSMDPAGPYAEVATVPGRFPVTEWLNPFDTVSAHLLRVERVGP